MTTKEINLPHNFTPRDYQLNIWNALDSGVKRAVWVVCRRGGKDLTLWNWSLTHLIQHKKICYFILPTYSQAKKIIWEGMTKDGIRFLDFIPKELIKRKSESELSIRLINDSLIQLVGSDNVDRLVGTNPGLVVFSEASLQDPRAWGFLRPILAENNGIAIFQSTPRGKNSFYDLYVNAKRSDDWFCELLTADDTQAISKESIQKERDDGMSEELIQQEFYCSFEMGIEGSYYGRLLDKARMEGRIGRVIHDPTALVHSSWDIGIGDSTSLILFQQIGQEIHIIDCYESNGEALSHYVTWLRDRAMSEGYNYGQHYLPHDIENRELSSGVSRKHTLINLGIKPIVLPTLKTSLADGIEVARGMFPRFWIDDNKCERLIKALENYRKAYDAKNNIYSDRPIHDWSSHYSDSLRYLALACKLSYSTSTGLSSDELYRRNLENRRSI